MKDSNFSHPVPFCTGSDFFDPDFENIGFQPLDVNGELKPVSSHIPFYNPSTKSLL